MQTTQLHEYVAGRLRQETNQRAWIYQGPEKLDFAFFGGESISFLQGTPVLIYSGLYVGIQLVEH